MKVVALLHEQFEGPGMVRSWAESRGHAFFPVALYENEAIPEEFDMLVVMGGPQSPSECSEEEKQVILDGIERGVHVVGICLGAQLIGEVLGAPTEKSPHSEYGFFPIEMVGADPLTDHFPERFRVMHWHADMPGLPKGAEVLAISEGCPRQIIRFREGVYGFQCHLEMTPYDVRAMVTHCESDLAEGGAFVMAKEGFRLVHCGEMNTMLWHFLSHMEETCLKGSKS